MPALHRRTFLSAGICLGLSGCLNRFRDDRNTEPADRRVTPDANPTDWPRPTRSPANNLVSPAATPPKTEPTVEWQVDTPTTCDRLVIVDKTIVASTAESVHAVSLTDGTERWRVDEGGRVVNAIAGRCYVIRAETVIALTVETGETIWEHEFDRWAIDLIELDGTVYVTTDDGLFGLHADSGEKRWHVDSDGREGFLAVVDGDLQWANDRQYTIFAVDGAHEPTIDQQYSLSTETSTIRPNAPTVVDGTIAIGGADINFGAETPVRVIDRDVVYSRVFEPYMLTPAIVDDRILIAGYDNRSGAMETSTVAACSHDLDERLWETTVDEPIGAPAVADGVIYTGGGYPAQSGDRRGKLYALTVDTGEVLWEIETAGANAGHPLALVGESIVLGSHDGISMLSPA